jgi:hypothetical protein
MKKIAIDLEYIKSQLHSQVMSKPSLSLRLKIWRQLDTAELQTGLDSELKSQRLKFNL